MMRGMLGGILEKLSKSQPSGLNSNDSVPAQIDAEPSLSPPIQEELPMQEEQEDALSKKKKALIAR